VVSGLPSIAEESGGGGASGPSGVIATGGNKLTIMIGLGANPELRDQNAELASMGTIVEAHWRNGNTRILADIAAHAGATNPIDDPDSTPVSILRQGSSYVVADAGGNTVVRASKQGATSTIAVLPGLTATAPPFLGLPVQAVPTSVAVGPDGAYYVSQLTGFPFEKGLAKIYRIGRDGSLSVYAQGLTNVTDLAFADDGTLYAVQISTDGLLTGPIGALVKVNPGGAPEVVAGDLFAPYGLALSGRAAYVTTGSVLAEDGEVVRIPLP
jgi:sugar lactone lactonase YvrE